MRQFEKTQHSPLMIPDNTDMVFISDLHLSERTPMLNQGLISLIQILTQLPQLKSLYILGDWLDGWIGDDDYLSLSDDDKRTHFLTPIIDVLKILSIKTKIYVMHGNRDFALSQKLCAVFGGVLIKEPYYLNHKGIRYRLEHGDVLCTDDTAYQRYRAIMRSPVVIWLLLKLPLSYRRALAQKIKQTANHNKSQKTATLMDTNAHAVKHALSTCEVLIHGHTHRPHVHEYDDKVCFVLGDWQEADKQASAVIGLLGANGLVAYHFRVNF